MKDLSLHILDIVQNSTRAKARRIQVVVEENAYQNLLSIMVKDDGVGMPPDMVERVADPFVTSRTTRKVGMGISLLKQSAEQSGGSLSIISEVGVGTTLIATFCIDNIDTPPMGDLAGVMAIIISGNPGVDFLFVYRCGEKEFTLDTLDVKEVLGGVPVTDPKISIFLREMMAENIAEIRS